MNHSAVVNCVVCFDRAVVFGGHVHAGKERIIAGRCKAHAFDKDQKKIEGCSGCFGQWTPEMGIDTTWCKSGYIDADGFHDEK